MKVTLYTVKHCSHCQNIKNLLNNLNICYDEVKVNRVGEEGDGIAFDEYSHLFSNKSPLNYIFPQAFIDGEHIGGYFQVIQYFKDMLNDNK